MAYKIKKTKVYELKIKGQKEKYPFYLFGKNKQQVTSYLSNWVKKDLKKGNAKLIDRGYN